jgi:hypothetical protein
MTLPLQQLGVIGCGVNKLECVVAKLECGVAKLVCWTAVSQPPGSKPGPAPQGDPFKTKQ